MAVPQLKASVNVHHSSIAAPAPDPEVAASAKRRKFSSKEKRRILAAADRCTQAGDTGALLRRSVQRTGPGMPACH